MDRLVDNAKFSTGQLLARCVVVDRWGLREETETASELPECGSIHNPQELLLFPPLSFKPNTLKGPLDENPL